LNEIRQYPPSLLLPSNIPSPENKIHSRATLRGPYYIPEPKIRASYLPKIRPV
jgi:hypothetical protein